MANEDRLLTVNEVAERLRVHPITVRRHIKAGDLRAVRVGRAVRVQESDLEEYMGEFDEGEYEVPHRKPTPEQIAKVRQVLASVPKRDPPHPWPPTREEMERRKKLTEEMFRLRAKTKPLGMTTAELIRQVRREREEQLDRASGLSRRRIRRGKMASDRRERYGES